MQRTERRTEFRPTARFKPACLQFEDQSHIALLRDVSLTGAGFETDLPLKSGQPVWYRWGNTDFVPGVVAWTECGRVGVRNLTGYDFKMASSFDYRSVRVPTQITAKVHLRDRSLSAKLVNLAQRGLCLEIEQDLPRGTMMTVEIARRCFEAASARWCDGNKIGVGLRDCMRIGEMSELLQRAPA